MCWPWVCTEVNDGGMDRRLVLPVPWFALSLTELADAKILALRIGGFR